MAPEVQQLGANRARSRSIAGYDEHLIAPPSGADDASPGLTMQRRRPIYPGAKSVNCTDWLVRRETCLARTF